MYHELERPQRPLCDRSPGYTRYVVREESFVQQLEFLRAAGLQGTNVTDALPHTGAAIAITFDDGCESDLVMAAPALAERGFGATFYITTRFLGQPGYLNEVQLRMLADSGFEIGSHGVTHRFLSDLADVDAAAELSDSKKRLEDIIGRPVVHFSCPGGRWDRRIALAAADVGYVTVATSCPGPNSPHSDRFKLARNAILRHTSLRSFEQVCKGRRTAANQIGSAALSLAKTVLGNRAYVGVRSTALVGVKWSAIVRRRFHGG